MPLKYLTAAAALLLLMGAMANAAADAKATPPADFNKPARFPLGAYLSWERPIHLAKFRQVDHWRDVCDRLDRLVENGVDTLWVVNLSEEDFPRLIHECEERGLALLPNLGSIEARVEDRWINDGAYYDAAVGRVVKLAGNSPAVIGWVLSDEPTGPTLPRLELLRKRFQTIDPARFCVAVAMWGDAPRVPLHTRLPVVCVDLYPFFGPNDPNGPHTDATSQAFFRTNAAAAIAAAQEHARSTWIMGQCFNEIWGPRKYDSRGHLMGLPGSYLHWRTPSLAEIRWQVWETVRSGATGVFIYTLAPEAPQTGTASLPPPDVAWKNVLAAAPTDMGPNALTNPDATASEQLKELGKIYRALHPLTSVMLRWRADSAWALDAGPSIATKSFFDPATNGHYLVLVNDNLQKPVQARLRLPSDFRTAEMAIDSGVTLKTNGAFIVLSLDAGAGAVLRLSR